MSDHTDVYGICENLCKVPIYSKDQVDEKLIEAGTIKYNAETDMIMIYDGTTWHNWKSGGLLWDGYIYNRGVEQQSHAGSIEKNWASAPQYYTFTRNEQDIDMKVTGGSECNAMTHNKVDLTNYTKLVMKAQKRATGGANSNHSVIGVNQAVMSTYIADGCYSYADSASASGTGWVSGDVELDISNLTGEYYIFFGIRSTQSGGGFYCELDMTELYLE